MSTQGVDLGGSWTWPSHGDHRVAALAAQFNLSTVPQRLDGSAFAAQGGAVRNVGNAGVQMAPCGGDAVRIRGGYAQLPKLLAGALPAGSLRLGCAVTAVEAMDNESAAEVGADRGSPAVRVSYRTGDGGSAELLARRVVLALPPGLIASSIALSPPLPPEQRQKQAATATWCGDWAKVSATFRSAFWRKSGASGVVATQGPIQIWWEGGGGAELDEETHALVGLGVGEGTRALSRFESGDGQQGSEDGAAAAAEPSTAAASKEEEALRSFVVQTLGAAFGESTVAAELLSCTSKAWIADERTYASGGGAQHRDYGHPLLRRPAAWGVHFAGTETEQQNGHVEGAIAAGERAAAEVLSALGG